jgi:hypothetical protein
MLTCYSVPSNQFHITQTRQTQKHTQHNMRIKFVDFLLMTSFCLSLELLSDDLELFEYHNIEFKKNTALLVQLDVGLTSGSLHGISCSNIEKMGLT